VSAAVSGRDHDDHDHDHHAHDHGPAQGHGHGHDDHDDHDHDHDHDRGHRHGLGLGHAHAHAPAPGASNQRAFAIAIALNTVFVIVEFGAGFVAQSTALMADAGHNLSDVLGLMLAGGAALLARRTPSGRYTYGLRSTSILAALGNAMLLLVACGAIGLEAVQRLAAPPPVDSAVVMGVAAIGIVVNGVSAALFARASHDLNVRGAFLHLVADAAISLGVVLAGLAMRFTGWLWLDPLVSLVIVAVILWGTWGLLRGAVQLALAAVPPHVDAAAVTDYLRGLPGVAGVHDLHIWGISTTESALTVHLVMPDGHPGDPFLDEVARALRDRLAIQHATLQVEHGTTTHACCLHVDVVPAAR
jgi:cobalt-zinc-cadmium efflux system protein